MMPIAVPLGSRTYRIRIADSYALLPAWLARLGLPRHAWIVTHRRLLSRYGRLVRGPLERAGWTTQAITVPESERAKSLRTAEAVIEALARQAAMRTPLLMAFGGGVVGDLTGFVAAVFRRGVPYVHLPTTLLAQVDSAIGGKVAVDVPFGKNLIGAFYQPRLVVNHLGVLRSLPPRQMRSGLSEIIKYGVMADEALFSFIEAHPKACLSGRRDALRLMIERSCRIKARVVARDERDETGLRAQLNFGHTLGHALESATGYGRFTHGEAIAVGMACAAALSVRLGRMTPEAGARLVRLLRAVGLPTRASGVRFDAVRRVLRYDKKFVEGRPRWVLPTGIGRVIVTDDIPPPAMWASIRSALGADPRYRIDRSVMS